MGAGYIWPNLSLFSDRARTALIAKPTHPQGACVYRYTADWRLILPTDQVREALESFIEQMRDRLRVEGIGDDTNLDHIWARLQEERHDPRQSLYRRLEAQLGCDPDDGPEALIERMLGDLQRFGEDALLELAAARRPEGAIPDHGQLSRWAKDCGYVSQAADRVAPLAVGGLESDGRSPAWKQGYQAARAFRERERVGSGGVSNARLAEWCAVSPGILDPQSASRPSTSEWAFELRQAEGSAGHLVLRSRWETGRRFELARLLGDWLSLGGREPLRLASASQTYRQKFQRAFAAELLCPFSALEAMLAGDYSDEAREEAAHAFQVSEQAVTTLLVNHRRLSADELDGEADTLNNDWSQAA